MKLRESACQETPTLSSDFCAKSRGDGQFEDLLHKTPLHLGVGPTLSGASGGPGSGTGQKPSKNLPPEAPASPGPAWQDSGCHQMEGGRTGPFGAAPLCSLCAVGSGEESSPPSCFRNNGLPCLHAQLLHSLLHLTHDLRYPSCPLSTTHSNSNKVRVASVHFKPHPALYSWPLLDGRMGICEPENHRCLSLGVEEPLVSCSVA